MEKRIWVEGAVEIAVGAVGCKALPVSCPHLLGKVRSWLCRSVWGEVARGCQLGLLSLTPVRSSMPPL